MPKRKAEVKLEPKAVARRKMEDAPHRPETIAVIVGAPEQEQIFNVHTDLLIKHSNFFRAALSNDWKESRSRRVELRDVEPEHFEVFKDFLYTGFVYCSKAGDSTDPPHPRLACCWVLGERVLCTAFKDAASDAFLDKYAFHNKTPLRAQFDIYPNSTERSCIRRLLVDFAAHTWHVDFFRREELAEDNAAFIVDVAIRLVEIRNRSEGKKNLQWIVDRCEYHEHVSEKKPCYLETFRKAR
ncbi:uncharacterized protein LTR77_004970 [Saxophila tyrrhenica]|uniref:BTB domain-containing protein n=1 Tax=Saxophila tyrrhenica TaxID=1690608 RepID=A0AAV9PBF3_9PEZI|nr:hypothetical protein LTR77_004970 [Saxophila tyrrhenica]